MGSTFGMDDDDCEVDLESYDAGEHGYWTCLICGFDANDHDTCMGCGHPLTEETFSID